jgi:hypothetical protein
MPSHLHENLVEMFRERPEFAAELLADPLGIPVPAFEQANLSSAELNNVLPTEFRADLVVNLTKADVPVLAVVIEAQLGTDDQKRRSWPAYVGTLHARLGCPIVLLVVCAKASTATWCATPIPFGIPNLILTPVVIGPRQVPPVTDPAAARNTPELTVLSTLAYGNEGPDQKLIFEAFLSALNVLEQDHAERYADVVMTSLDSAARTYLEALMTTTPYRYQSDFALRYFNKGQAEGEIKGEIKAVLTVLDARGVELTGEMRKRISECTDADQLDLWIKRAVTAVTADELFA